MRRALLLAALLVGLLTGSAAIATPAAAMHQCAQEPCYESPKEHVCLVPGLVTLLRLLGQCQTDPTS